MKIGELIDMIREVERAEGWVEQAEEAILHGGNQDTMNRKHEALRAAQEDLARARDEEIKL